MIWIVILAILLLGYFYLYREDFLPCEGCDDTGGFVGDTGSFAGLPAINPYTWPYSGTSDIADLYVANLIRSDRLPLTHLSAPDHVVLTN